MDVTKLPSDPVSLVVLIIAGLVFGVWFVAKYLKESRSETTMFDRLTQELQSERELRRSAESRADNFADQRNSLVREFSDMKRDNALIMEKMQNLTIQHQELIEQNHRLAQANSALTQKVEHLTNLLEQHNDLNV